MLPTNPLGAPDMAQVALILEQEPEGTTAIGYTILWDRTGTVPVPEAYEIITTNGAFTIAVKGPNAGCVVRAQAYYTLPEA